MTLGALAGVELPEAGRVAGVAAPETGFNVIFAGSMAWNGGGGVLLWFASMKFTSGGALAADAGRDMGSLATSGVTETTVRALPADLADAVDLRFNSQSTADNREIGLVATGAATSAALLDGSGRSSSSFTGMAPAALRMGGVDVREGAGVIVFGVVTLTGSGSDGSSLTRIPPAARSIGGGVGMRGGTMSLAGGDGGMSASVAGGGTGTAGVNSSRSMFSHPSSRRSGIVGTSPVGGCTSS